MAGTTEVHAGTLSESWLHDTLEQLIAQIRALLDVTGVAFVTIDADRAAIRPAAAWFATEEASRAFTPLLQRPYDPTRAGVTEAAVESGTAVLIPSVAEWPGAEGLRARLDEQPRPRRWPSWRGTSTAPPRSSRAPVRTAGGRTFGVLAISSNPPLRALDAEDLRTIEVFARLAALALERSELLEREAGLRREEGLVNRALPGRRRVDRPRGRLHRDRRAGGGAVGRHAGAADALRPGRRPSCAASPGAASPAA